jgi:flagellar FliL protein
MKKLVLILLVLILLGGGGAAAWWFFLRKPPGEPQMAAAPAPVPPSYFELPLMVVPVIRDGASHGLMTVGMTVQLKDETLRSHASERMPVLNDRLFVVLYDLLGRRLMQEQNFNLDLTKGQLLNAADRVMGQPGAVTNVIFTVIEPHIVS